MFCTKRVVIQVIATELTHHIQAADDERAAKYYPKTDEDEQVNVCHHPEMYPVLAE
mgnify:CR=1 FL=1